MSDDGIQMSFRLSSDLHYASKASAESAGQTLAEWIRRAMREKLEREKTGESSNTEPTPEEVPLTSADVESMVREAINKVLAEKGL